MSEKVGEIYFEVTLDTAKMIEGQREADKTVRKLETRLTQTAAAAKLHTTATNLAAQAMRNAASAAAEATGATADLAQVTETAAKNLAEQVAASNALAAVSGGLIAAIAATAAAVGLVAIGYVKGSAEMVEFKRGLALTGNQSGVTADQLNVLAQRMDSLSGVTRSQAAEAVTIFASAGIQGEASLAKFTEAAIRLEQAGGPAIDKTAAAFKALGHEPLQAALKLNESVNFLTTSLFEQIRALEQQGRTTEAAKVAQNAYADALLLRTPAVIENIGLIERGWRGVKNAAKEAWDAVLGVGRSKTPDEALASTRAQIENLKRQLGGGSFGETAGGAATGLAMGTRARADKTAMLAALEEQVRLYERAQLAAQGSADADAKRLNQVRALAEYDKSGEKFLSDRLKMERDIAVARELGVQAGLSNLQIEQRVQDIRASYAKKGGERFDSEGYLAGLEQKTVEAYARIAATEEEALRKNAKLLDEKKITAQQSADAITLIEAKAAQDRRDIVLHNAEGIRERIEKGGIEEAAARKKLAGDQAKGQQFATGLTVEADPIAKLQLELEQKSALLAQYSAIDQGNLELYAQAKLALETETAAKMKDIRDRENQQRIDTQAATETAVFAMAQSAAGQMLDVLKRAGKDRTALGKALFLAERALAIATIIVNTEMGAAKAIGIAGPFGIPLATLIRATGYASAAMVGGLAVADAFGGGRQYGGPTSAGTMYRVNETGRPEMFTAANGAQYMLPTKSGTVTPADQVGAGGVQVNVHNYAGANVEVKPSNDGRIIDIAVRQAKAEIADEITNRHGSTWGALRTTNVQGRIS